MEAVEEAINNFIRALKEVKEVKEEGETRLIKM